MMRALYRLRRSVALFICPELRRIMETDERQMREMRATCIAVQCEAARGYRRQQDVQAAAREAGFLYSDALHEMQKGLVRPGFVDLDELRQFSRARRSAEVVRDAEEPFLSGAEMDALIARRRHRRVERCKEILQVIYLVNEGGLPQEPDLLLDARAERLAVLLFEEKPND